ncbi:MAG: MvaI/BcnI family restriction endonuclease [Deltaproteobacteria bacterium]
MRIYTKESIIQALEDIADIGWIPNARPGNAGGVGNTLESLLEIKENNLPLPNAAEWELKCQRFNSASLITLFHIEPSPRAIRFVPRILLPKYGWPAGEGYPTGEMSFRQTIHGQPSDRGFNVAIDKINQKLVISFNPSLVNPRHSDWLHSVDKRVGLDELNPQPYWGFRDLSNKAGTKLLNCFYVQANTKREKGREFFHYKHILMLSDFDFAKFLEAIELGDVLVDFDARTGHNHGTKFRLRQNALPNLYRRVFTIR